MKQVIILNLILVASLIGCKKGDENNLQFSSATYGATAILSSGSWKVAYYSEGGYDRTSNFKGYVFSFSGTGLMAAKDYKNQETQGNWTADDGKNEIHFSIGNSSPLSDISNGWIFISKTNTEVNIKDDNSSHNEELRLVKI